MEHFDIIIIGSGAGGGTMAKELAETGKKILILERGDFLPREKDNWDPKAVFVDKKYRTKEVWHDKNNKPFVPNTNYWVGGNTSFYGAALMRMKRHDFEETIHEDGISPSWPLKYDDYKPYYDRAEKIWSVHGERGIDPNDEKDDPPFPYPAIKHEDSIERLKNHFEALGWHPSPLPLGIRRDDKNPNNSPCIRCNSCDGFPCLVMAKADARTVVIEPALKYENISLYTNHKVLRINTDITGKKAESVDCEYEGKEISYSADLIILAAGAINSAALLLKSADYKHPDGLGNSSGLVGRNYMFHTTSAVVSVMLDAFESNFAKTLSVNDFYFGDNEHQYPMGQVQLLDFMSGQTVEGQIADKIPPILIPDIITNNLAKHMIAFLVISEDLGKPENRVTLNEDGTIKLIYTPNNLKSHKRLIEKLTKGMNGFSIRDHVIFEPHYTIDEFIPLYGTAHQCGTLRFGMDKTQSVLDINCKLHDVDNLYVTDASFFPSSSAVNPTLTIIANCLRVAEYLKANIL